MCMNVFKNMDKCALHVDVHSTNTRTILQSRTKKALASPNILGLALFNRLPVGIKKINSTCYKKILKGFLIDKIINDINEYFDSS